MTHILLSAHAGGPEGHYQPNSLQAALAVRDDGVDLIEFDVHSTKDGQFIAIHDNNIKVSGQLVRPEELSASIVLKEYKGSCLLKDMLQAMKDHAIAHVDYKSTLHEKELVDSCLSVLNEHEFIITTTENKSVKKIRQLSPKVQIGLSIGRDTRDMNTVNAFVTRLGDYFPMFRIFISKPTMLAICYKEASPWTIFWAKKHKLPIILWTIDSKPMIKKAWSNNNIWAFVTNNPRKALAERYK